MERIMLYSGGLDSYIIKAINNIKSAECLFVDMGTAENKIERKRLPSRVKIKDLPIAEYALPNHIIPFRNNMLVTIAAQYSNQIMVGFTAGDTTRDKDYTFKSQMEEMLNYFAGIPEKVNVAGPFTIDMTYKSYTKSDLVKEYISHGFDTKALLTETVSCYTGTDIPCGECRSCIRKYVALEVNGIDTKGHWRSNPMKAVPFMLEDAIRKGRDKDEIADMQSLVLKKHK